MIFYKRFNLTHFVENLSKSLDLILSGKPSNHSLRVAFIAVLISYKLNLTKGQRINLYLASLLHDVGAVDKETKLLFEYEQRDCSDLQHHAIVGYELLKNIPLFEDIADIIKDHHNPKSNNLLSRIIYLSDEADIILRNNKIFDPKVLDGKIYLNYKNKPIFKDILDAFSSILRNDAFLMMIYNIDEIKKYLRANVEVRSVSVNHNLFNNIAKSIAESFIDKKSRFTLTHSSDVAYTAFKIAKEIGLSDMDCQTIKTASFLHDIGKLFVPVNILEHPGKLESEDWFKMKSHVYYTYSFLNQMNLDENIIHIASSHHEYLDGSGYPFGLDKTSLSTGAQILTVADIYSALRRKRPYRNRAFNHTEATEMLLNLANCGKINKELVDAIKYVDIFDTQNTFQ